MTMEEYINRPMTGDRVIRSLFSLFCENYDDLELRENYEAAMEFYDDLIEETAQPLASGTGEVLVSEPDHLLRSAA